jgi:hypothetical protein
MARLCKSLVAGGSPGGFLAIWTSQGHQSVPAGREDPGLVHGAVWGGARWGGWRVIAVGPSTGLGSLGAPAWSPGLSQCAVLTPACFGIPEASARPDLN